MDEFQDIDIGPPIEPSRSALAASEGGKDGISEGELSTCIKVITALASNPQSFMGDRRYRVLRKELAPLADVLKAGMFDGMSRADYKVDEAHRRYRQGRIARERALDEAHANKTMLRASRLSQLQALQSSDESIPHAPDGAALFALKYSPAADPLSEQPAAILPAPIIDALPAPAAATTDAATAALPASESTAPVIAAVGSSDADAAAVQDTAAGEAESKDGAAPALSVSSAHGVTGAVATVNGDVVIEPPVVLAHPRPCYTCKTMYRELHFFYAQMCPRCASLNFQKRNTFVDLRGRVAIVTGGRVKIGYHVALRLLRCGARVIVTSRFPIDAAERFAAEPDYATWANRLTCYGLDLRHMASVEEFVAAVGRHVERLDILINNACQTVRRPAAYYAHLLAREQTPMAALPDHVRGVLVMPSIAVEPQLEPGLALATAPPVPRPAMLTQLQVHQEDALADPLLFPPGQLDVHGQQIDLRTRNSWTLRLHEVETPELAEVFLVNAMAPFVLASKLKPVMMRCPDADKFIVNVSAMEGKFYRHKSVNHPHTNMAKAALNMMTRTSAEDYKADRIYMTSVDTGWINDENPREVAARIAKENNFQTPLDEIDAAARILDPVFVGLTTGPLYSGLFFKDYRPTEW
eukprot:m.155455 g.155455  ORF g.155455 m.155455 type:complete len:640 (+) comp15144_c0_seq1:67-1986(+)